MNYLAFNLTQFDPEQRAKLVLAYNAMGIRCEDFDGILHVYGKYKLSGIAEMARILKVPHVLYILDSKAYLVDQAGTMTAFSQRDRIPEVNVQQICWGN